jgi:branched-subunit amino acid aminotransferase/4-amino-4-deoxychorismate lyase
MLLEQARECGIVTREERLTLDELEQADAVLLTGSLALVERAGHRPRGTTGEIAAALAAGVAQVVRMGEDEYITQNAPGATAGR